MLRLATRYGDEEMVGTWVASAAAETPVAAAVAGTPMLLCTYNEV